jgi:hypothetical protein
MAVRSLLRPKRCLPERLWSFWESRRNRQRAWKWIFEWFASCVLAQIREEHLIIGEDKNLRSNERRKKSQRLERQND